MTKTHTQTALSGLIGIRQRTISAHQKRGAPVGDTLEYWRWLLINTKRISEKTRKWGEAHQRRAGVSKHFLLYGEDPPKDEDKRAKPKAPEALKGASLEEVREFYLEKLHAARKRADLELIKFWNELLLKTDESIRRSEAHAKRLNLDHGELLSRTEVERILRAIAWGGNASMDKFSKQIAQRISEKKPAEVYSILKPTLVALTLFEPLTRLSKAPGEINLPDWVVKCFKTEEKNYIKYEDIDMEKYHAMKTEVKGLRARLAELTSDDT